MKSGKKFFYWLGTRDKQYYGVSWGRRTKGWPMWAEIEYRRGFLCHKRANELYN
jgi:hypothetical protein